MSGSPSFQFDQQRLLTDVGTIILTRFLQTRPGSLRVENVEADRGYRRRDIDLIWHRSIPGHELTTVEIKCDAHAGTDESLLAVDGLPYYARETGNFAIETVSVDVSNTPGWVFASEADMLLYYFVAIPRTVDEIQRWLRQGEDRRAVDLGIAGDRLYVIDLPELRRWFERVQNDYREVAAQNEGYRTLSRLVPCQDVVDAIDHCYVFDAVCARVS